MSISSSGRKHFSCDIMTPHREVKVKLEYVASWPRHKPFQSKHAINALKAKHAKTATTGRKNWRGVGFPNCTHP